MGAYHTNSRIRKALRKQLGYVARDIRYLEQFMGDGYALERKEISLYLTIITLYEQQKYMYDKAKIDRKQEYQDNTDRIEVERAFSLDKRCYGMGLITTKLEETQLTSIALSVFVSNLLRMQRRMLYALLYLFRKWDRYRKLALQISV